MDIRYYELDIKNRRTDIENKISDIGHTADADIGYPADIILLGIKNEYDWILGIGRLV